MFLNKFKFFIFVIYFFYSIISFPVVLNDMVPILPGEYVPLFRYGSVAEKVYVNSFMINKYPITNFEFEKFVLQNPNWNSSSIDTVFADKNYLSHWTNSNIEPMYDYPVVYVSWFAADAYCSYVGGRLPTIDEWEYVSSAGFFTLDGRNEIGYFQNILEWYISSQVSGLVDVFNMQKNYWEVYGLHGVVWEWVSDFNSVILLNTDAEGGGLEEVLYCGATATNAVNPIDYVAFMRFAFRNTLEANYTSSTLGFRCVFDVK
ncbi:MAG TPA: formylglycine-generating enzyme family protein [Candidatus Azoamicus sp.]